MTEAERPGLIGRVKQRWSALKAARPSIAHVVAAWQRVSQTNGNQYAAAITFFSFLALFPLLLLAVSIAGFVLQSHPDTLRSLFNHVSQSVPGSVGDTLNKSIADAIKARTSVGIIGLAGVLLTGLGWIGNLRLALDAVWKVRAPSQNFITQRITNGGVLAGLGLGALVSVGLTAFGTALTSEVVKFLHLDGVPGTSTLVVAAGLLLAIAGDVVIFSWVLIRLPHAHVPKHIGLKGAVLAAVGFEVLKVVGTYTIKSATNSPTAGPFASLLAVLVWIQLVARLLMFVVAWTAILTEAEAEAARITPFVPVPEVGPEQDEQPVNPVAVGAGLVGVGAVAGAAATAVALQRAGRRTAQRTAQRKGS